MFGLHCEVDAPVGIVVTDWFNLSLYKIAADATSEHADRGRETGVRTCLSSRVQPQHQQPHFLVTEHLA